MNIPDSTARPPPSWFDRFRFKLAGIDIDLMKQCPGGDWDAARAVGNIMILTWLYQTGVMALSSHAVFAEPGTFHPEFLVGSAFLATFIMMLDSFMVMRSSWSLTGIAELKRAGLDISGGRGVEIKNAIYLGVRLLLSAGIAQILAILMALWIFNPSITTALQSLYDRLNEHIIATVTQQVDAVIERRRGEVKAQSDKVAGLNDDVTRLRQIQIDPALGDPHLQQAQKDIDRLTAEKDAADAELQKAQTFSTNEMGGIKGADGNSGHEGRGLRYQAAVEAAGNAQRRVNSLARELSGAHQRFDSLHKQATGNNETRRKEATDRLPALEEKLKAESDILAKMTSGLDQTEQNRGESVRRAAETTPGYVTPDFGLIARLRALDNLVAQNPWLSAKVLIIEIVAFLLELSAVLAKVTSYVPTHYARIKARDDYMGAVEIVDDMTGKLEPAAPVSQMFAPSNDNYLGGLGLTGLESSDDGDPPPPPKRKRGRPRKVTVN